MSRVSTIEQAAAMDAGRDASTGGRDRTPSELVRCRLAGAMSVAYRILGCPRRWGVARRLFRVLLRLERGGFYSATARELLRRHHDVEVGAYSYGECMIPGVFPPGVTIGRYTSIAPGVRVYNQNHPLAHLSTHPFFYDPRLRCVGENPIPRHRLRIGNDVWVGVNAIITPGCTRIGDGAVIGAGAVVTRNVDDFAIVAGNPARLIRYRFAPAQQETIRRARWWDLPLWRCVAVLDAMTRPLEGGANEHPLLSDAAGAARSSN